MAQKKKKKKPSSKQPSLKPASGAGFSFEDKVTALLFCEMLAGRSSLGPGWGVTERIERQAADLEPFGDLLITVAYPGGVARCASSVKSNRQLTRNGCSPSLRDDLWTVFSKPVFKKPHDYLGLFCAELSNQVSPVINQLCRQAYEEDRPERFDAKIKDQKHRKIYDSFRNATDKGDSGLPWHILSRLVPREFDFESATSRSEDLGVALSREILGLGELRAPQDLWSELLGIARELRDVGGSATRESLASKLRSKFQLREDPFDESAWSSIRRFAREWMDQIETNLSGGLTLPRDAEVDELRKKINEGNGVHVIGESGSGKSALLKRVAAELKASTTPLEVVWIKSDQFPRLVAAVPTFVEVLQRTRRTSGLLIFDAMDGCGEDVIRSIGGTISAISSGTDSPWKVTVICQTPEWPRVSRRLVRAISGHDVLSKTFQCGDLSPKDMALVLAEPSIQRLASRPHVYRMLCSPKILDLLLAGRLEENLELAGEADLVEWWWREHVIAGKQFAAEEIIVLKIAIRMADDLATEVPPDVGEGSAESVDRLIRRRVMRRTSDGRIRFDHDLLSDWARVMHLRTLGDRVVDFMRTHTETPPWLRAIRLLSQHLLERAVDTDRWRAIIAAFTAHGKAPEGIPATDLQVLDAWLEGIVYCTNAPQVLNSIRVDLFAQDGWLLKRLIKRLLFTGTAPDPVVQKRFRQMDAGSAERAAMRFRLPQPLLWQPILDLLTANSDEVTDYMPTEIAEIGAMYARLDTYVKRPWPLLAELTLLNGEKELQREVAGEYRHDRGSGDGDGRNARMRIYGTAMKAASELPERAEKLLLKAAGRRPWDKGDVSKTSDESWRGEWHDTSFGHYGTFVKNPIESWEDGSRRRVSTDFMKVWLTGESAVPLYRERPDAACEATLAFLIDWPKSEVIRGDHSIGVDRHGFRFEDNSMSPAFWTEGPFLSFLREKWQPALDLVIRLTNFATDRYEEWWPYEPTVTEVSFDFPGGTVTWKGNHQVYGWNRSPNNVPNAVTCALMALEKYFYERIDKGLATNHAVQILYEKGRSISFAGLLVSIGKRHPKLFLDELKPLLFVREVFTYDLDAFGDHIGAGFEFGDDKFMRDLRKEWNQLPGRSEWLREMCCNWLISDAEFPPVLNEVSNMWRKGAEALPKNSDERRTLLGWAVDFDRSTWKEVPLADGQKGWRNERPSDLLNLDGAQLLRHRLALLKIPYQCSEWLKERPYLAIEQLDRIWEQLQDWAPFERVTANAQEANESDSIFLDHRHARSGLFAVLLGLGRSWLEQNPSRRSELEEGVRRLLADPPKVSPNTEQDTHDDFEGFIARCVVQCWAASPENAEWRGVSGRFVTAYRFRTVWHLFDEAFRVRTELRGAYRQLEALALSFSVARREANTLFNKRMHRKDVPNPIAVWSQKWLPEFEHGRGPEWIVVWTEIEKLDEFAPRTDISHGMGTPRYERHRRDYGLAMGVVIAALGHLPALDDVGNDKERDHWLNICRQMLGAFCRTLPENNSEEDNWKYEIWWPDEKIIKIVARRIFECSNKERHSLWQPILDLPPQAHHHIDAFLNAILFEALNAEPPQLKKLVLIWRNMVDYLQGITTWLSGRHDTREVWKVLLLYDSVFTRSGEEIFAPLVDDLRSEFEWYVRMLTKDAHEQSSVADFLTTRAGRRLLLDALVWLRDSWESASDYFWETAVDRGGVVRLLEHAWNDHYELIRRNPDGFQAFKTLTINLAARHVPIALQIQQEIGTKTS